MEKPIYKYATVWGILGGTALSFIYLKTLGKDKNLSLVKTLLIGAGVGAGVGLLVDNMGSSVEDIDEETLIDENYLRALAKTLNNPLAETELETYLLAVDKSNLSDEDERKIYRVLNGLLLAKKDNKWDEGANIQTKKQILMGYGVAESDFKIFEQIIINKLTNLVTDLLEKN